MEPRPFSRGDAPSGLPHESVASMEPQLVAGTVLYRALASMYRMLQWSRDHSVAETRTQRESIPDQSFNGAATIQSRRQPIRPDYRHRSLRCGVFDTFDLALNSFCPIGAISSRSQAVSYHPNCESFVFNRCTTGSLALRPCCPIAPHRRHYHTTVGPPSPPVPPASAACPTNSAAQSPGHVRDRRLLSGPCPPRGCGGNLIVVRGAIPGLYSTVKVRCREEPGRNRVSLTERTARARSGRRSPAQWGRVSDGTIRP